MAQNPYELRLNVAMMAKEMLERESDFENNKFYAKLETMRSEKTPASQINDFIDNSHPKMYTDEQLVSRAQSIYSFVANNKSTK